MDDDRAVVTTAVFTASELEKLSLSAHGRIAAALQHGEPDAFPHAYAAVEKAFRANRRGFEQWAREASAIVNALPAQRRADSGPARAWLIGAANGVTATDVERGGRSHLDELVRARADGGPAAALELYSDLEASFRRLHDALCDWVAWLWSEIYRAAGVEALESAMREMAGAMRSWMEADVATAPRERAIGWSGVLAANFSTFRLEEDPDRFRFLIDPCGTCSRRIQAGAYEPPIGLAVVHERHPLTYGTGDVPVYRTHVPVMHWMIPIERMGVPWPIVRCPPGLGTGQCTIELMKDPAAAPPDASMQPWTAISASQRAR